MKIATSAALGPLLVTVLLLPVPGVAEEGGGGHYMPGASASFIDALPGKTGVGIGDFFSYYRGSAAASKQLPSGGLITGGLDATAYANTVLAIYRTPLRLLGGYYAVGLAVPYVWMSASAQVQVPDPRTGGVIEAAKDQSGNGFGDILVYPFMLGWTGAGGDLKSDVRLGVYAPTGKYEKGSLANVGKNYWTFEPGLTVSWISSKVGLEASAFAGMDFNTTNGATDYRTGTQVHLDATVAEHLPLLGGAIGVGANAFYYQQVTGDSGAGAKLGDFEGRTVGVGPVGSFITKAWGKDLAVEVKWLPEIEVDNRLKGDIVWAKVAIQL